MGTKAGNLHFLKKSGFNVPDLISVENTISDEKVILEKVDNSLPDAKYFAVRSSASNEDSETSSLAGHYYSAVGVSRDFLYTEYQKVVASYKGIEGKVIIQEFIPSEKAGVIFTDRGDGKAVINAAPGLCKTVVEGKACDEYIVSDKGLILEQFTATEKDCLFFAKDKIIEKIVNQSETLNQNEIISLLAIAKKIEKLFGKPQDIEFCIYDSTIYILQSRPITRKLIEEKNATLYDSANIAESYSGIVQPLTVSFATHIYKIVYQNLLIASGLSKKKIQRHKNIFDNMISSFYGRLYYNMNNWYLMMSFMPGYKRNKQNLEDLITSNIREEVARDVLPAIGLKTAYPFIVIYKLIIFNKTIKSFIKKAKTALLFYRNADIKTWDFETCKKEYLRLSADLLEKWHIPVENDFLMMTYLGILKKKFNEETLKRLVQFGNISSQQVESLKDLSGKMYKIEPLRKIIKDKDANLFSKEIKEYPDIYNELNEYFDTYGGRFANELKLESPDISEDFSKLLTVIQLYWNYKTQDSEIKKEREIQPSPLTRWTLKRFKKYASQREVLRLLRSNCFGIVRKLFCQMGKKLVENEIIEDKGDIFYLELDEIFDARISDNAHKLKEHILKRKVDYSNYKDLEPKSWFELIDGDHVPVEQEVELSNETINARPCTHGVAEGKARVFKEFYFPDKIDFDILVARHTDPGWTPLIGLAKGLIIEHGGILSHAAIVSRELGIPTVIGAKNATNIIKDNTLIKLDGKTGLIKIIKKTAND